MEKVSKQNLKADSTYNRPCHRQVFPSNEFH